MPERAIELNSYHSMLGCVVARMGIALLPKSVLATFSANAEISVHNLTSKENRVATVLIWRSAHRWNFTSSKNIGIQSGILALNQRTRRIAPQIM